MIARIDLEMFERVEFVIMREKLGEGCENANGLLACEEEDEERGLTLESVVDIECDTTPEAGAGAAVD